MGLRQATPPAALSGYQAKAPGFAGGYLLLHNAVCFAGFQARLHGLSQPDRTVRRRVVFDAARCLFWDLRPAAVYGRGLDQK